MPETLGAPAPRVARPPCVIARLAVKIACYIILVVYRALYHSLLIHLFILHYIVCL